MRKLLLTVLVALAASVSVLAQEYLPTWQEGWMDFHSISTGQGESTFIMMPDGTTMLVDAGDVGELWTKVHLPDSSKTPGEWIAHYIRHFSSPLKTPGKVDYFLLTHFHDDHLGSPRKPGSGYFDVLKSVSFDRVIDRGWPDYDFPSLQKNRKSSRVLDRYIETVRGQVAQGTVAEQFLIGSTSQIRLLNDPKRYDFEVYNIAANARMHTGRGLRSVPMWPEGFDVTKYDENVFSCAFTVRYGKFKYYLGGDLSGATDSQKDKLPRDFETLIAPLVGPVTVMKADHHGYKDSSMPVFLWTLRPDVIVIQCAEDGHPKTVTAQRFLDPVYPGRRDLYITGDISRVDLGEEIWSKFKPYDHVVVRVYEGGDRYQMFVLDPMSTDYRIIYKSEIYEL